MRVSHQRISCVKNSVLAGSILSIAAFPIPAQELSIAGNALTVENTVSTGGGGFGPVTLGITDYKVITQAGVQIVYGLE